MALADEGRGGAGVDRVGHGDDAGCADGDDGREHAGRTERTLDGPCTDA